MRFSRTYLTFRAYITKNLYSIGDPKQTSPAISLVKRIFGNFEQDNINGEDDWKKQVDLFLEGSRHDEYEHQNRIMRFLIEDPLSSQGVEGSERHESKVSEYSIGTMRATVIEEARQMYHRYGEKHPGAIKRAAFTFFHWRQKHSGYNYDDISERSLAKRSLITLFYRLNVTDTLLDEIFEQFVDASSPASKEGYDNDGIFHGSESSDARGWIRGDETLDQHISFGNGIASSISHPLSFSYCLQPSPTDSHCCSFEALSDEECQHGQKLDCSNKQSK